jgi:F-type H+-transporting ATPase subunit epsilon
MNGPLFRLKIVTPTKMIERDISHIRLRDETGFFGVMKDHINFLTVLEASLCYYLDAEGKEVFLAVDGGIFHMSKGTATLTSRDVFESDDVEKLSEAISGAFSKSDATETAFVEMIKGIEKSFIEKTLQIVRGN